MSNSDPNTNGASIVGASANKKGNEGRFFEGRPSTVIALPTESGKEPAINGPKRIENSLMYKALKQYMEKTNNEFHAIYIEIKLAEVSELYTAGYAKGAWKLLNKTFREIFLRRD